MVSQALCWFHTVISFFHFVMPARWRWDKTVFAAPCKRGEPRGFPDTIGSPAINTADFAVTRPPGLETENRRV